MKQKERPAGTSRGQEQKTGDTINLRFHNTINPAVMQAPVYPPGWLIARLRLPLAPNPISRAQGRALHNLIQLLGREAYRGYKSRLSIPLDTPLHRLSKAEAWRLINVILADLEGSR